MITDDIKDYINENYKGLLRCSLSFTNDINTADDLLQTVLLQILTSKSHGKLKDDFKENIFVYIYVALKNQYFSQKSFYNRTYMSKELLLGTIVYNKEITERGQVLKDDNRLKEVYEYINSTEFEDTFDSKKDHWYCKKVWEMYYKPEDEYTIEELKELELKEMINIRNSSYRKMQASTDIDFRSLNKTVNLVNDKIKNHFLTKTKK